MQVFFGFLWNRHLSLQNFRLYSSSFFSLSCWNKDFSPFTWVSDTSAVGLQRRNGCRMLAVVKLFKRTFRGPSLNWLPERKCPMKSICVLRSLTHRAFSKREGEGTALSSCMSIQPAPGWPPGLCVCVEGQSHHPTASVSPRAAVAVPCWLVPCPAVLGWPLSPCTVEAAPLFINITKFTAWGNWN